MVWFELILLWDCLQSSGQKEGFSWSTTVLLCFSLIILPQTGIESYKRNGSLINCHDLYANVNCIYCKIYKPYFTVAWTTNAPSTLSVLKKQTSPVKRRQLLHTPATYLVALLPVLTIRYVKNQHLQKSWKSTWNMIFRPLRVTANVSRWFVFCVLYFLAVSYL